MFRSFAVAFDFAFAFVASSTPNHSPALGRHPEERSDEGPLFDFHRAQTHPRL
jgi:hypothetical protein